MTTNNVPHILIIGGGISGLATAYYLQKQAAARNLKLTYTLVEKEATLGGKVVSQQRNGFVIEGAPDSFLTQKPWALALARELGLEAELIGTNDQQRSVYILHKGQLCPLPAGWRLTVPTQWWPLLTTSLLSPWAKIRALYDLFVPPRLDASDESLADFVTRRFGREVLDKLAAPIMAGIHIADPARLSIQSTFARYPDMEKQVGSLIIGSRQQMKATQAKAKASPDAGPKLPMFISFKGGMATLTEALTDCLTGQIVTGQAIETLQTTAAGHQARLADGSTIEADALIVTTPANIASQLLRQSQPDLATKLAAIRYISSATISLAYKKSEIDHPLDGFGFVVPKTEPCRLLACTWVSTKFDHRAPTDQVLLRAFVGGYTHENLADLPDEDLLTIVREELQQIMGITATPTEQVIYRWPKGTPQYDVGHLSRVAEIETLAAQSSQPLYLTSSAFYGVGLPDCIHQAERTAQQLIESLMEKKTE